MYFKHLQITTIYIIQIFKLVILILICFVITETTTPFSLVAAVFYIHLSPRTLRIGCILLPLSSIQYATIMKPGNVEIRTWLYLKDNTSVLLFLILENILRLIKRIQDSDKLTVVLLLLNPASSKFIWTIQNQDILHSYFDLKNWRVTFQMHRFLSFFLNMEVFQGEI